MNIKLFQTYNIQFYIEIAEVLMIFFFVSLSWIEFYQTFYKSIHAQRFPVRQNKHRSNLPACFQDNMKNWLLWTADWQINLWLNNSHSHTEWLLCKLRITFLFFTVLGTHLEWVTCRLLHEHAFNSSANTWSDFNPIITLAFSDIFHMLSFIFVYCFYISTNIPISWPCLLSSCLACSCRPRVQISLQCFWDRLDLAWFFCNFRCHPL